jgi:hypothetical protein
LSRSDKNLNAAYLEGDRLVAAAGLEPATYGL